MNLFAEYLAKPYPDIEYTCNSIETNDEDWGIQQFVSKIGADLIAVTTREKTGFFVTHSIAENLVNHEDVPLLVLG
jgi:nucleotide-binding universal stress UspA family protein